MNVRELRELIKDLPDDMLVQSCCDNGGDLGTGTVFRVKTGTTSYDDWETEVDYQYLWCGYSS